MNHIKHVAIIMDGNGRWGIKHKNSRNLGHKEGIKTVEKIQIESPTIVMFTKKFLKYKLTIFSLKLLNILLKSKPILVEIKMLKKSKITRISSILIFFITPDG